MSFNANFQLPPSWIWVSLDELSESMQNGIYKPSNFYDDNGIACLIMYNIENGEIVWKDIKRMILTDEEISQYELKAGDLLINRVNSRELVGKTAAISDNLGICVYESKNIRLRVYKHLVEYRLIAFYFRINGQKFFNQNVTSQ